MSIIKLNVRPLNLKLKYPFGISRGTISCAKNVLVTITYGDVVAYGESAPSKYYGEDQDSVIDFLNSFVKRKSIEDYLTNLIALKEDMLYFSENVYRGPSASARVALEMAFWDLMGKINNKSLYQYFFSDDPFLESGNGYRNLLPTSYTIGLDKLLVIEEKVHYALSSGFNILKIKLGLGIDEDTAILKTIGNVIKSSACKLRIDANGGWNSNTAKEMIDILQEYNVELLEQPLPKGNITLLTDVVKNSPFPIIVDEDCVSLRNVESLAGKVHGVNIKLMKSGSVIEVLNMINLAKSYNMKVMLGCMIESSCSISAAVHLSPLADYVDLDGHLLLDKDPFSGLLLLDNKLVPSLEPGLGVSLSDN